jgi:transcription antitermination factor NusG
MTAALAVAAPERRWYVAATAPRLERIAQDQLTRAGVGTFLPLRELPPDDIRACAPLWPGYLFVASPYVPQTATAARRIVATEQGPIATPRGLVERLMAQADKDGIVLPYKATPRFAVGDHVRIEFGPLTGSFGTIARINGHHVRVEINLFSRTAPLDLRSEQLSRVA